MDKENNQVNEPSETPKKGISRRGFLKGAGLTTAGTVLASTGAMSLGTQSPEDKTIGPDAVIINLKINGRNKKVSVEPRAIWYVRTMSWRLFTSIFLLRNFVVIGSGSNAHV